MKQACKYHPAARGRWYCARDGIHFCDECVASDDPHGSSARCMLCNRALEAVPTALAATPFYQILPHFLRYPAGPLFAALALVMALPLVITGFDWTGAVVFAVAGLALAACGGTVLHQGLEGRLQRPTHQEFLSGEGWSTGLQCWLLWAAMVILAALGFHYAGLPAALAVVVAFSLLLPAVFLALARHPNPARALQRIHAPPLVLGRDYLLMAAALAGAGALVLSLAAILHDLVPARVAAPLAALPVAWLWLFSMRLTGYLGSQYQDDLEIETRERELLRRRARNRRPETERRMAVLLREGRYDKVLTALEARLEKKPEDPALNEQYARLLEAMGRTGTLLEHAERYFFALFKAEQGYRVPELIRRYRELDPKYRPRAPELRWQCAQAMADAGEHLDAVRILQGLHEQNPDWHGVGEAYVFMARLLAEKLDMEKKAEQFLRYVEKNYTKPKTRQLVNETRKELGL